MSNGKVNINMFVTDKLEGWFNINVEKPKHRESTNVKMFHNL